MCAKGHFRENGLFDEIAGLIKMKGIDGSNTGYRSNRNVQRPSGVTACINTGRLCYCPGVVAMDCAADSCIGGNWVIHIGMFSAIARV